MAASRTPAGLSSALQMDNNATHSPNFNALPFAASGCSHPDWPIAPTHPFTSDDDALNHAAFDGFVSSIIQHGGANISVIGQSLRFLQR